MSEERKHVSFKCIVLGDSGVGKTSLVLRQSRGQFSFVMAPTIGTSHMKTTIPINDYDVELKIWDTAGQEQFAPLVSMYARGANVCILVASFFDPTSLKNLEAWRERLREANENPPIVVAVNKTDMVDGAPMTIEQIREEYGDKYPNLFFVSAKSGDCVNELFACAAQEALNAKSQDDDNDGTVQVVEQSKKEKKCC
jgi:small GTP-binding protein